MEETNKKLKDALWKKSKEHLIKEAERGGLTKHENVFDVDGIKSQCFLVVLKYTVKANGRRKSRPSPRKKPKRN